MSSARSLARFYVLRAALPLALGFAAVFALELSGADAALADACFDRELDDFPWRHHWFTRYVLHDGGKQLVIAFGVLLIAALVASRWRRELVRWRRPMAYVVAVLAIGPLLTSAWKDVSDKRCPWDLVKYGGFAQSERIQSGDPPEHRRGCFPCGQASSGFALMSLYFALRARNPKWARRGLALGIVYGTALGVGRMLQGAHYASHVVATALVCWSVALVLYELMLRRREAALS